MSGVLLPACAVFFSTLLCLNYFLKDRVKLIENRMYSIMLVCVLIDSILVTTLQSFPSNGISELEYSLIPILNRIDFIILITDCTALFFYNVLITFPKYKEKFLKPALLFILFNILILAVTFFLDIELISDNGNYSITGTASFLVYGICAFYIILSILIVFIRIKHVDKRHIPVFAILFIISLLFISYQLNPYLILVSIALTFINYIMYFTIENPDKRLIDALNEAKIAAEKANHAKSDFLSSMSHEIRTPLNAIVGFSDCILEEETLDAAKNDAKDIKLASENLLEIVNGILDISKIEADKMEIVETDYNVLEYLDNVAKLVKPRIGDKPIDFRVEFAKDLPYIVHGDGGKVRQIVTNILTNAAKYTEKGSIHFNVNCVNQGNETTLVISVEDTGRGIKPEQIDKLFNKFQRLEEDKNTTLEGTGLGLAITKRFVEMMGGKIVVQSKYGFGSKFIVYLKQKIVTLNRPVSEENDDLLNTMQIKLFDFTSCRVLVVDDNKVNIKVALKLLSNYGITADSCESGFEAIDKIKSGNMYDLVLLDDMMPKMSGVETLKKLREIINDDIKVVALTANALAGMKEKYLSDGFDDYLAKPIEKTELYRILLTYLNNKMQKKEEEKLIANSYMVKDETDNSSLPHKKSVLVVDDNKINIKIATKLLSNFDLNIDSALSGKEAIEKVKSNNYDLIFMDIMMTEMDGVETLHHLRDDLGFKNPVVTLTADAVKGSKEKYLSEGFNDYIAKPIDSKIIESVLNKYL